MDEYLPGLQRVFGWFFINPFISAAKILMVIDIE